MRKTYHRTTWMFFGSSLLLFAPTACQNSRSPSGSYEEPVIQAIDRFPQSVGTKWLYRVEETGVNPQIDTIEVHISRLVESTDTSRTWLWTFSSRLRNIEWPDHHVTITGNEVVLSPLVPGGSWVNLLFPLKEDSSLYYNTFESTVEAADTIVVPSGRFVTQPVFSVWKTGCLSCVLYFRHWYTPDIGFVRMQRMQGVNAPSSIQTWNLVDWDPEPGLRSYDLGSDPS